jgi:hypothetical protein
VHPPDRIKKTLKKKHYTGGLETSRLFFFKVNRVKPLVLLLPHVKGRKFLAWPGMARLGLLF